MRLFAEVKTSGLMKSGHHFNVGDLVEVDPNPENDIYYPAIRVEDGMLQYLKSIDFEIVEELCNG